MLYHNVSFQRPLIAVLIFTKAAFEIAYILHNMVLFLSDFEQPENREPSV